MEGSEESKFVEQRPARPRCFLDLHINSPNNTSENQTHRIIVELYADICPITCENFRCLCTGEKGISPTTNKPLHYKDSTFHRVVKNFMIQGGDTILGNGKSGESIYGKTFPDENFEIKHDKPYMLSMANKGKDTNSSQFFITTVPAPHLDGIHVAFGHVISGQSAVRLIEEIPTDETYKPAFPVIIQKTGELVLQIKKKLPQPIDQQPSKEISKDVKPAKFEISEDLPSYSSDDESSEKGVEEGELSELAGKTELTTSGVEVNANLPPEIPRNYLLRRCDAPITQKMDENVGEKEPGLNGRDHDIEQTQAPWLAADESSIEMARLRAIMSQHLPNPEVLGSMMTSYPLKARPTIPHNQGDARGNGDTKSGGHNDSYNRRDHRHDEHDTVYRHLDSYYEDRKRKNHQELYREDEMESRANSKRQRNKRIPAHILRKLGRSSTPPHWKDAQRRLVKIQDLEKGGKLSRVQVSPEFEELKKDQQNNYLMNLKTEKEGAGNKHYKGKGKSFWTYKSDQIIAAEDYVPNLKSTIKLVKPDLSVQAKPIDVTIPTSNKSEGTRGKEEVKKGDNDRHHHSHHHKHHHSRHHHHSSGGNRRHFEKSREGREDKSTRTKYRAEKGRRAASIASASSSSSSNSTKADAKNALGHKKSTNLPPGASYEHPVKTA